MILLIPLVPRIAVRLWEGYGMAPGTVLYQIAREMLANEGLTAIWRLHVDAATLYGIGNEMSALVFLEIADAAAEEWQRRHEDFSG